ncbi:MAG TPA: hypothetical protein VHT75_00320 [Acidimicrobiales bacterium]|jgi:hypothetical protein|nr:hypothetical protein [Acidimicrobiales bacterium]
MADGFVGYRDEDSPTWALVRFRPDASGRLEVASVHIASDERGIDSNDLRSLPLGRIEAFANGPNKEHILARIEEPFDLDLAMGSGGEALGDMEPQPRPRPRIKLKMPSAAGRHPDDFYRRVAALYLDLAQRSGRPAADIARANEINVSTVHRWIKEARRRGFLPPGRAGKAG